MTHRSLPAFIRRCHAQGRRRIAIAGLSALMATVIALPTNIVWVAMAASGLLVWGIWSRPSGAQGTETRPEPMIWDDGFGAR